MPTLKLTLQNRLTTVMVISSVLLISTFTVIQLNNQLVNINRYNSYRANLSNIIVKNSLENILRQTDPAESAKVMQSNLDNLKETNVMNEATVFDQEGKVIVTTEGEAVGESVRSKDLDKWQDLQQAQQEGRWFTPEIDIFRRRLDIYIAVKPKAEEPMAYIAKISFSLGNIQEAFSLVYKQVLLATIIIILLNILFGYLLSKAVVGPIKILNEVTKMIAAGNLSVRTEIHTEDELQELGETFNYMTEELVKMKERAENANPLTKLPGNIIIHEEAEKRINDNQKFMVIYCDLDNFKAFNDKYGIAKGDEAIKLTADIFKEAMKAKGNAGDFIGHEGGDDFILLTTPDKADAVADFIIKEFDSRVRSLYNQEDLERGFIVSTARDNNIKQFPIMTISLAGVTNAHRPICSYAEITNIAAEVKKKAKSIGSSVFIVDKRQG
jgi:diguanylate cyclase (GGDEF)-like protein